jgi:hypothetical protein
MTASFPHLANPIPQTLQKRLGNRQVLPFVGAGVSMAIRHHATKDTLFPSWKKLLLSGADWLEQENKRPDAAIVRGFLEREKPNYLEAAKIAREGLGVFGSNF